MSLFKINKNDKISFTKIIFYILMVIPFFPITIGVLFSVLLARLFFFLGTLIYVDIYLSKYFRELFEYLILFLGIILCIFCFLIFNFFGWLPEHMTTSSLIDDFITFCKNGDFSNPIDLVLKILKILGFIIISSFFLSAALIILFRILFFKRITTINDKDEKIRIDALEQKQIYSPPRRTIYKFISSLISWRFIQKTRHLKKVADAREKNLPLLSKGSIVNKADYVIFPKRAWHKHALFVGSPKTGKTTDQLNWVLSAVYNNCPVIYFDSKNDQKIADSLAQIAKKFKKQFVIWDANSSVSSVYNPFAKKNVDEITDSLLYALSYEESGDTSSRESNKMYLVIYFLINFILTIGEKISLKNLVRWSTYNFLNEHVSKLRETLNEIDNEEKRFALEYWLNQFSTIDPMLFNKVNEDLSIVTIESKNAVSANGGFTVKDILAENKNNVIILFRLSQNFNTHRPDFVPKLLFCDLINFAVFNDIERAKNKNITLVCIHGLVEFISSLETGRQTIIDLGTKGYSFGFDIENVRFTEKKIVGIVDMLFSICKTQFIHRNVDPQIQEYFLKYSEDARLVFPKFQYLEIKSKFAKISSQEHNEASNAQIAERKKALVSQFSTLVPGTAIFKTIYYSSRGSMNIDVQEDIVYNTPIEIRKFANAIASISDSNPYASELDAKEKRKIPNSVSNNVNTIGTTNNNVGTNNYDDSDEEIYIIGGDEEQNAAPIYIPDVDNPQKISNLPTVKKKK